MKNPGEFILALFNARTVAHVIHLQSTGPGSYAGHVALGEFYEAIVGLADRLAEAYQGLSGQLIEFKGASYKLEKDPIKMLDALKASAVTARGECESPMLQQILDDIIEQIASTSYKIKYLA